MFFSSLVVLSLAVASSAAGIHQQIDSGLSWDIIGGKDAPNGFYPHQVSIQIQVMHHCGGSIISSEWIVTAAHCVKGIPPILLKVLAGTNKLLGNEGVKYQVREIYAHESFDIDTILNDVAIIRVDPITFTDKIQPINLELTKISGDANVILTGWGTRRLGGIIPNHLQHLKLKTTTIEFCRSQHTEYPVEENQVCTLTKAGEGACHGDSGGPLIKEDKNGRRSLVGIVSWGEPCAEGLPDVFARVSSYAVWFNSKCNCIKNL